MPSLPTVAANANANSAPQPAAAVAPPHVGFSRGMVLGLCGVACLATAAIVLVLARPVPPPPTAVPIRVVSTSNQPTVVHQPVAPPPSSAVQPAANDAPATATDKPKPAKRGAEAHGFTLALRRQQAKLEGCFRQHSVELEGQPTMQLEFDLEASGAIKRVGISPKALAVTSLGECLLSVAQRTKFPEQANAVSFAIPLTARRAAGSATE
jgi:hypothetical protein